METAENWKVKEKLVLPGDDLVTKQRQATTRKKKQTGEWCEVATDLLFCTLN